MRLAGSLSLLLLALVAGCSGTAGSEPTPPDEATPVRATYFVDAGGVQVGIQVAYAETREVTEARFVWAGHSDEVALYPDDGTDPDVAPDSITVEPGMRPTYEGRLLAACPDLPSMPVFEIDSTNGSGTRTDRYRPDNLDDFAQAFDEWCGRPVTMDVRGWTVTPEGDYEARLEFSNPGPAAVEVVSQAYSDGVTAWEEAAVTVPGGSRTPLTVPGHGPSNCRGLAPPWETGHIVADGVPLAAPESGASWC